MVVVVVVMVVVRSWRYFLNEIIKESGETKQTQFNVTGIRQQNISSFNISMNFLNRMKIGEPLFLKEWREKQHYY